MSGDGGSAFDFGLGYCREDGYQLPATAEGFLFCAINENQRIYCSKCRGRMRQKARHKAHPTIADSRPVLIARA